MQAKNYAARAHVDLMKFSTRLEDQGLLRDAHTLRCFSQQIERSVHFTLPSYGKIFDSGFKGLFDSDMHLPYPSVTLEYSVESDANVDQTAQAHAPKRLVLAFEISTDVSKDWSWIPEHVGSSISAAYKKMITQTVIEPQERIICVWGASVLTHDSLSSENEHFVPEMCMWLLPGRYPDEEVITRAKAGADVLKGSGRPEAQALHRTHGGLILGVDQLLMQEIFASAVAEQTREQAIAFRNAIGLDIAQEAAVTLEFIEATSCSNIKHDILQKAPKQSVNDKRKRDGKVPLFETRTLVVDVPGKDHASAIHAGGESTRSGPRQHLRRGHIRRIESGKRIWVQPAVIGAGKVGEINKQYVIRN